MLVDDVLFSGRTIRAALDALNDLGRPRAGAARRPGRPRPPRAADPRRLRRQEPADLAASRRVTRAGSTRASTATTRCRRRPSTERRPRVKRHLLSRRRPDPRRRRCSSSTPPRRCAPLADRPIKKLPDAARPHRGQPVLRGLHPHPHLVRGRRQAALGRRHQLLRQGLERLQGREPQGHRADPRGDGRRRGRRPARRQRRAAPAGARRLDRRLGVVNAGDGTHEHPTQALLDAFTMRRHLGGRHRRPRRPAGRDRRRRPAQPGRPLQRAAAAHPRRRGHPGRAADAAAGRRRGAGRARRRTTSTRCCPRPTS